jgi:hypothetical protein
MKPVRKTPSTPTAAPSGELTRTGEDLLERAHALAEKIEKRVRRLMGGNGDQQNASGDQALPPDKKTPLRNDPGADQIQG